jgi:hypothetical protein
MKGIGRVLLFDEICNKNGYKLDMERRTTKN